MALTPGARLGPYEIVAAIGAGGMGEVYRARDTKLNRDVALKVLPDLFANDPERLARFQREAQVLASLNHPNIAAIHGLEESATVRALVLELVEGPTLADRIARGPIPLDEALPIARQIAEGLSAAHERGIMHRDLKPANVKVTADGMVKVLDFGLAKALAGDAGGDPSLSPTLTVTATRAGTLMGTAAYMSPEQANARPVDKRADIWAFGCVLYEMLTGRQAFAGETVTQVLARILEREPDFSLLPANTYSKIRELLRHCLQKDPKRRLRDIGDALIEIDEARTPPLVEPAAPVPAAPQPAGWQRAVPSSLISFVTGGLIIGLAVWSLMRAGPPTERPVSRFAVTLPGTDAITPADGMTLSADGDHLVYAAARDGVRQLFLRARDQLEPIPLRGTEEAMHPFFSTDGEWVGFFTPDALKKVSLAGGPPVTLCEVGFRRGASWGPDNTIVFASDNAPGLMRVSAAGGEPQPLTTPEPDQGRHNWPELLADGTGVLFTISQGGPISDKRIAVLSLETGEQRILADGTDGHFASSGHLVFAREASLWAAPFDADRLELTGEPAPMVEGVQVNAGGGWAHYALAGDGSLVYLPAAGGAGGTSTLVWVDRQGREEPVPGVPVGFYGTLDISPNGSHVAVQLGQFGQTDVWTYDVGRATLSRLTTDPASDASPLWTLDGQRIVFRSDREGQPALFWQAWDGTGDAERLLPREGALDLLPGAWSPDGATLVFAELNSRSSGTGVDIGVLSMEGEPAAEALIQTEFAERQAALSPDGGWIAYSSDRSGQFEVYVERFPELGERLQISSDGGREPLWSPDGQELSYRSLDGRQIMVVSIGREPTITAGTPQMLFEGPYSRLTGTASSWRTYDLAPDGERFLIVKQGAATAETDAPMDLILVLNWFEELTARVPTAR